MQKSDEDKRQGRGGQKRRVSIVARGP